MSKLRKIVLGAALFLALALGVLTGTGVPFATHAGSAITVAHADGCDSNPPDPSLDCPPTPTPTPRGH